MAYSRIIRKNRVELLRAIQDLYRGVLYEDELLSPRAQFLYEVLSKLRQDLNGDYLAYSQDNPAQVSYADKVEQKYDSRRRIKTTLGRYIRRRLGMINTISDANLDYLLRPLFSSRIIQTEEDRSFIVLRGQDLYDIFNRAIGGKSCMTGDPGDEKDADEKVLQLYIDNPDRVGVLVYKRRTRALLWLTDEGVQVLDRIYPNDCMDVDVMQTYCTKRGIVYRTTNRPPEDYYTQLPCWDPVPLNDKGVYHVTLQNPSSGKYPYLDTFRYGIGTPRSSMITITLTNQTSAHETRIVFDSTGGGWSALEYCSNCSTLLPKDHDSDYCNSCREGDDEEDHEDEFKCERCDEWAPNDDATEVYYRRGRAVQDWCASCVDAGACRCNQCEEWWESDLIVWARTGRGGESAYCPVCAEEYLSQCDDCGMSFLLDDIELVSDSGNYCNDCADGHREECTETEEEAEGLAKR